MLGAPQWGIFDNNGSAILVDNNVFGVEYVHDYRVSDYPQEQGAFESYNKVQVPWQSKVIFLLTENRADDLLLLEQACGSLSLFTVTTPEFSYPSANLTHMAYRRIARDGGASLIQVEVWCEEIRIVGTEQFSAATTATGGTGTTTTPSLSDTQSPNGTSTANDGAVQSSNWQSGITATPPT